MQFYHSKYCQAIISVELVSNSVELLIFGFDMKTCIYIIAILLQIHYNTKTYYKSIILGEKVLLVHVDRRLIFGKNNFCFLGYL